MRTKFLSLFALLVLSSSIFFVACKKDIDTTEPAPNTDAGFITPAATPVSGSVSGIVVDENNTPVASADVIYGGTVYSTDARGFFNIKNVVLDKYVSTVTINRPGYFKAVRAFSANATKNYLSIKLIPKTLAGSISASGGGLVSLSNGTAITFQTNSIIVKSTGATYTGSVNVYASYIDPTASDFAARVPGSMMGQDATKMYVLQSTGMIAVDLESPGGEPLQIATGKQATIKLPIPSSLLTKAPATIDTWSLDDRGVWKKESVATKNGDFYEMQVTHFSFWNCDVPANAIYLTLHVHDQNSQVLPNTLIELTIPNNTTWWATTYGYTDSLGNVSGLVPSNQTLEMTVYPNPFVCPDPINTQNIGPFAVNTTLDVTATVAAPQILNVTGTANNCNNQPIQNGTAIIYNGQFNMYYANITNGTYSATLPHCNNINFITVTVIEDSTFAEASSGNVSVTGNSVVVPLLTACNSNPGGAVFSIIGCQATGTYTAGTPLNASNTIITNVEVQVPGAYNISAGNVINGFTFTASGVFSSPGMHTVVLQGSGTPVSNGTYTFITQGNGAQGCALIITVGNGGPTTPAVFSLGGPGTCPMVFVAGDYVVGFPLSFSQNVTLTVTVTTPGYYSISTGNPINGMTFSDSGYFTVPGMQTVVLNGYGVPQVAGANTFTPQASGVPGCTFIVNTINTSSTASFTFNGAPGNCQGATVSGVFQVGVPLTNQQNVMLTVNVTSVGTYSIGTNGTNGVNFSGTGIFTATGMQTVMLMANGTPTVAGINTYISEALGTTGCAFTVTTIPYTNKTEILL